MRVQLFYVTTFLYYFCRYKIYSIRLWYTVRCPSGWRSMPGTHVYGLIVSRVRIPSSPKFKYNNRMKLILPLQTWTLWFPISLSRVSTWQTPTNIRDNITDLVWKRTNIHIAVVYTDTLYFHNEWHTSESKNKYENLMVAHKNWLKKLVDKHNKNIHISYTSWNQQYLQSVDIINNRSKIYKTYTKDSLFRKFLHDDCKYSWRKADKNQINFFIEEHLITFYAIHNILRYSFWERYRTLSCYSWPMLKHQAYMYTKNIPWIKLSKNIFGFHQYDPVSKTLYDARKIKLSSYMYS